MTRRDLLLLGLTMVSACADAISYLGLGHVFPANMTGNTVLLGVGLATGDMPEATRSATALGAFLLGAAAIGAAVPDRLSDRAFRTVVAAEIAMTAAVCGWWLQVGADAPVGAARYGLIALFGATMGAQSSMIRLLDVPVSTTYITGTWTALSAAATRYVRKPIPGRPRTGNGGHAVQALVVTAYCVTAYGAALAYTFLGGTATAIPLGILVLVAVAITLSRCDVEHSAGSFGAQACRRPHSVRRKGLP
ncbi:MAG: YoaK family protein [Pseudonocardiaceae bacterium]